MGIGKELRRRVHELGLSEGEAARKIGMSEKRFSNYVLEDREPDFETLQRICHTLDITPNRLLGFQTVPNDMPADEVLLLERYRALSVKQRKVALNILPTLRQGETEGEQPPFGERRRRQASE